MVEELLDFVKQNAPDTTFYGHGPEDFVWNKDNQYPIYKLIDLMPNGINGWKSWLNNEVKDKPKEYSKLFNAKEIKNPIIVSTPGEIWDGWHRAAAAIINGHKTIPAIVGKLKENLLKNKDIINLEDKPEDKVVDARTPSKKDDGLGKGWRTLRQDA